MSTRRIAAKKEEITKKDDKQDFKLPKKRYNGAQSL